MNTTTQPVISRAEWKALRLSEVDEAEARAQAERDRLGGFMLHCWCLFLTIALISCAGIAIIGWRWGWPMLAVIAAAIYMLVAAVYGHKQEMQASDVRFEELRRRRFRIEAE